MRRSIYSLAVSVSTAMLLLGPLVARVDAEEVASFDEVVKLTAADRADRDQFGDSVAIDGDTVVVGATLDDDKGIQSGSAYVFQRHFGGPDAWGQVAKLTAADGSSEDHFGLSVAIAGDTVIVGAPYDDDLGQSSGSAYVFQRHEGGPNAWGRVAKLTAADGGSTHKFGYSVAVSGTTVVVGAHRAGSGSAYVFQREGVGPDAWEQVAKLTPSNGEQWDEFGYSVAVDGDRVVVGARKQGDWVTGAAYVFERDFGGPDAWGQVAWFKSPEGHDFGHSVAIAGDTVVVGRPLGPAAPDLSIGAAFVFQFSDWWQEVAMLIADDGEVGNDFGVSVDIAEGTVIIGADEEPGGGVGGAYVFRHDVGGPDAWGQVAKLLPSNGYPTDEFGHSVSLSSDTFLVGAPESEDWPDLDTGSAYVFVERSFDLSILGTCPGSVTIDILGATPNGKVAIAWSRSLGGATIPRGVCAGTEVDLSDPRLLAMVTADSGGGYSATPSLPPGACGAYLQAVDLESCAVSNVNQIPE